MKTLHKAIISVALLAGAVFGMGSCTDPIRFGNEFLEKAPGGTVTSDTVFTNAEYTRQFLAAIYSGQYYALPTNSTNSAPQCRNYWKGMPDALSDTFQLFFTNTIVGNAYYTGALTSSAQSNNNYNIYPFNNELTWQNIRKCYLLLERIDEVPDLGAAERERMKDEAKCLLVSTYFQSFRHYGGLPIIEGTFSGSEESYDFPRGSIEQCTKFMVGKLDEVIAAGNLPWGYTGAEASSETGRWTKAAAMALKIKILQFVASPLFNSERPYWDGSGYTVDNELAAWWGGYNVSHWNDLKKACEDFFTEMARNAEPYHLVVPTAATQEAYAYAFRSSYMLQGSPEVLMGIRVAKTANGNDYGWFNLRTNARFSYCPTQEYVEMFPWADGTPFNWEETEAAGKLDEMFVKGEYVPDQQMMVNRVYTRDPRLYETVAVNGQLQTIDWNNGNRSGANYETWVGGTTSGTKVIAQNDHYGTGYRYLKYYAGNAFQRKYPQWVWLSLSEVYLAYAEALCQTGDNVKALEYIDAVRARVGLGGLDECNPTLNLKTDKNNLLEEILRERACEFAFQDSRYFDLIRYKRADLFERTLHRLLVYWPDLDENGDFQFDSNGKIKYREEQWYKDRTTKFKDPSHPDYHEPSHFYYEREPITVATRKWWTDGFDCKWYLQPFPVKEVNKNYGLTQNAGW